MKLALLIIFICVNTNFNCQQTDDLEEKINYWINLIKQALEEAQTYQLPKNADQYKALNEGEPGCYGAFDYIIVGAGASGSVMANRLSATNATILLLEAGDFANDLSSIPNTYTLMEFTKFNWGFHTTRQKHACLGMIDQRCSVPRGKGVGGGSLINGLIYVRGPKEDFNRWAEVVNDSEWNYENVLPLFKRSERFNWNAEESVVEPEYHGFDGLLSVEYSHPLNYQIEQWFKGNHEIGYKSVDYNANKLGVAQLQMNTKDGRRWDDGTAFILPVLHRKNLEVSTGSFVKKLLLSQKTNRVKGVVFTKNGVEFYANAMREVILSAGSIQTPQILMLSGIGPKNHLKQLKIPVYYDLEVGSTLWDHPIFIGLDFCTNHTEPAKTMRDNVKEFLKGEGFLAISSGSQGVGFYPSTRNSSIPDIELLLFPPNTNIDTGLYYKSVRLAGQDSEDLCDASNVSQAFSLQVAALHPKSVGTLRLKSKNPYDYPLIDPRYLTNDHDINVLYEGVQLALKIANTNAMKKMNTTVQRKPLRACKQHEYLSKEYWHCVIRHLTTNVYHQVGTCRMGTSPKNGVVDSHGRVFGIKNLRVADCSVFPFMVGGHTHAIAVMIAERISDFILRGE